MTPPERSKSSVMYVADLLGLGRQRGDLTRSAQKLVTLEQPLAEPGLGALRYVLGLGVDLLPVAEGVRADVHLRRRAAHWCVEQLGPGVGRSHDRTEVAAPELHRAAFGDEALELCARARCRVLLDLVGRDVAPLAFARRRHADATDVGLAVADDAHRGELRA